MDDGEIASCVDRFGDEEIRGKRNDGMVLLPEDFLFLDGGDAASDFLLLLFSFSFQHFGHELWSSAAEMEQ